MDTPDLDTPPASLAGATGPEPQNITVRLGAVDLDRPMSPRQFAAWIGRSPDWVYRHLHQLPGVTRHSAKAIDIIPRYYVEQAGNGRRRR